MTLSRRVVGLALFLALFAAGPIQPLAAETADQPYSMNELKQRGHPPVAIKQGPPVYPLGLARAGLIGSVMIDFIIDEQGAVRNPYVVESNNPWFERPAIDAILAWKFKPGEINGKPVNVHVQQEIRFEISGLGQEAWSIEKKRGQAKLPPAMQWAKPPVPINTSFPVYPFTQLQDAIAGKAEIEFVVGADGRVIESKLLAATKPEFGLAVMAMIDGWRFQPAKHKDGTPSLAILRADDDFYPSGNGDAPVSDSAKDILYDLKHRPERIAKLSELDAPPKPRSLRPPVYPTALDKAGAAGTALIEFYVDKKGDAQLPRILSSSAPEFGYAGAQAVATWRFEEPHRKGKPVAVRVQVPIDFDPKARPVQPPK